MPTKIQFPPKLAKLSCKKLCLSDMLQAETEAVKPLFPPVESISTATYRAALNSLVEDFLAVPYINRSRLRIADFSSEKIVERSFTIF